MKRLLLVLFLATGFAVSANPWNGKIVLQGFWWDYWNNNYPNNWSTYLADLAPRLREMGIDAVWIPPTVKNKNATGSVGYSPFDHYDLGDKFQGGSTSTRFGTKDQYLRAVAILHANGIDVIQDMVWNHLDGAGSDNGAGGQDPTAPSNQWKNFRYVCFATPGTSQDAANYGARRGRFPKNWQNFHPNSDHNTEGDDITAGFFGPDICYYMQARGLSSNCSYNPAQGVDYMRNGMRDWSIWLKKQTGVDGFRLDAVKHFEPWATGDFLFNLAYSALFASGGAQMYAVGEWVGSSGEMDSWIDTVNSAYVNNDLVGTFDFNLRGALKSMTSQNGAFDLGSIPGAQQNRRSRTAPFVNSHDTFRPQLDGNGQYIGWNSGSEIGGHIDPNDPRIQAAYAIAFAVDGSPNIFFEDLFDLHSTTRRWTHHPTNTAHLPARAWLTNQIWCHQKLNFKDGAYKVRWQANDLLIIERSARAIIAATDNFTTAQSATIQTDFGPNISLHDYSGVFTDRATDANGRITIIAPPCNGTQLRRGYSIWGPLGIDPAITRPTRNVTQEWEMADDLGDSHPSSLMQGGALPAGNLSQRTAGKIYPAAGAQIRIEGYASVANVPWKISITTTAGEITNITAPNNLVLTFTPTNATDHTIKIQNAEATNPSQKVWIKSIYTAPRSRYSIAPQITQSPTNQYAVTGHTAELTVTATGNPTPIYQWQRAGQNIPGATNATLTLTNITTFDQTNYTVTIWNEARLITTAPAHLTIHTNATPTITNLQHTPTNFTFEITAPSGLRYQIEKSTDLQTWLPAQIITAPATFTDNTTETQQFYRITYIE